MVPQFGIAKLVPITPMSLWFMVDITLPVYSSIVFCYRGAMFTLALAAHTAGMTGMTGAPRSLSALAAGISMIAMGVGRTQPVIDVYMGYR